MTFRHKIMIATAGAMAATSVVGAPAVSAGEDVLNPVIAVRIDDSLTCDDWVDGYHLHPFIEIRNLCLIDLREPMSDGETSKLDKGSVDKVRKEVAKADGVLWTEAVTDAVSDNDWFHAWWFHAWNQDQGHEEGAQPGVDQPAFGQLGLAEAHQTATGSGVVIAVLDTGVDAAHPLLAGKLLPGIDLVDSDFDPSEERDGLDNDGDGNVDEAYGHGTFVAGIASQVAPDAQILPIRVLNSDGQGGVYSLVEGIWYAIESGADVINLSLGVGEKVESKVLKDAIKAAKDADIVVVAAAGNEGHDRKQYPASEGDVMSVGASDSGSWHLSFFSNYGKWVDVDAPGTDVVSAIPGGGYASWDGSSMAAPIVTGQAALLREIAPNLDQKKITAAMRKSARKSSSKNRSEAGQIQIVESLALLD